MKSYHVGATKKMGRYPVMLNDNGHYRVVGLYVNPEAARKAADTLNSQPRDYDIVSSGTDTVSCQ
jgi:hypothetical protein